MINSEIEKGYNTQTITYLPSEFKNYSFKKIKVRDLSISQVTNLSILDGEPDLGKLVEIYSSCFLNLTPEQINELLYIDFLPLVHFINHLSFGVYDNSFVYKTCECGKPHPVKYNLYSISFSSPKDTYINNLITVKPWTVRLKAFTVRDMANILELLLDENPIAFLASSIEAVFNSEQKELEMPSLFVDKLIWLEQFPQFFRSQVEEQILLRYPSVLPLTYILPCKGELVFTPDMTLKGLPSFSSV